MGEVVVGVVLLTSTSQPKRGHRVGARECWLAHKLSLVVRLGILLHCIVFLIQALFTPTEMSVS